MNKYICKNCKTEFDYPPELNTVPLFVKIMLTRCPNCRSNDNDLTNYGKLMIERKAKLLKIKKEYE